MRIDALTPQAAAVDCRDLGTGELVTLFESLRYEVADLDGLYGDDPLARHLLAIRYQAVRDELHRRRRLSLAGHDVPDPRAAGDDAWRDLTREVRQRASILHLLTDHVHAGLTRVGRNGRRDCDEYAGACPWCGGRDRFRVWPGPPGACWCRQCGFHGDVITVFRQHTGAGFREAVRFAALELGLPVPERQAEPAVTVESTPTGDTIRVRRGGRNGE